VSKLPSVSGPKSLATLSPLQIYLQEVARYPLLNAEEEYQLALRHFEEGDQEAAQRLVTSNLRLVVKIANDFRQAQISFLDLIQEGNYGLMQAVKRFNPYKQVKLSTYAAWWIRAFILKHIMEQKSQVKMGTTAAQRKLFYNLKKEADRLVAEYDRADPKLIAENLNVKESEVLEMQKRLGAPDLSLDTPFSRDDSSSARGEWLEDQRPSIVDVLASNQEMSLFKEYLDEFKQSLNERELKIFQDRLLAEVPLTLQDIGDRYGVTRERARQIESRIMQKLKQFVREKGTLDVEVDD
jgi:RNA polymerase sigma-32 factor